MNTLRCAFANGVENVLYEKQHQNNVLQLERRLKVPIMNPALPRGNLCIAGNPQKSATHRAKFLRIPLSSLTTIIPFQTVRNRLAVPVDAFKLQDYETSRTH